MLTASGVLKIMDFGIARVQGAKRLTRDGSVLGTLAYAAPEQIKSGEGEPRSDQYSLACVIYEMLCGRLPFEATTEYELMQAHIAKVPDPCLVYVPDLPAEIDRALMRALAKNPADRFETVEEFGRALGTDAVQLQAVDMVRALVASAAPIPAIPQRSPSSEKRGSSPPVPATSPPAPAPTPVAAQRSPSRIRQHSPLLVMGIAAVVALGVAGFIFFDSRQPVAPALQTAQVDPQSVVPNPPAQPPLVTKRELEPVKPEAAKPEASKPAEVQIVPPPDPPPIQAKPAEKLPIPPPQTVQPKTADKQPDPGPGELRPSIQPAPPEKLPDRLLPPRPPENKPPLAEKPADKPPEPPEAEKKPEPPPMPSGPANYQGRVVAWLSPSTIMVRAATGGGFEKLTLYGIRDRPVANQKEADEVRDQLEAFMSKYGRDATCFNRYSTEFKQALSHCFINKHDMALWAIENKLGQTANVAPDNYPKMPR
jgi:serine/threonine-protein kinase